MENKILAVCTFVALLSGLTSGQEKFLVCKNIENVFTDSGNEPTGDEIKRIQGPPGKKGIPGSPGPPGLPGIQGTPGNPAVVDYDHISDLIERKLREGLVEVNSKVAMLTNNITEVSERQDQRCEVRNGLLHEGKCFFIPYVSSPSRINHGQAVQRCNDEAAVIAGIRSRNEQQAIEYFFRSVIPSSTGWIQLWAGMLYENSEEKLLLRTGKKVDTSQFKWHTGYPSGSDDEVLIEIRIDTQSPYSGLFNTYPSSTRTNVLCEV